MKLDRDRQESPPLFAGASLKLLVEAGGLGDLRDSPPLFAGASLKPRIP